LEFPFCNNSIKKISVLLVLEQQSKYKKDSYFSLQKKVVVGRFRCTLAQV